MKISAITDRIARTGAFFKRARTGRIVAALCLTIALVASSQNAAAEGEKATVRTPGIDAERALAMLVEGNRRFASGKSKHPHEASDWRSLLEGGQHPFAVVLGCSDSRVPPELIFDQGFGDLFVIRVAGNVVDTDVSASVEYALDHLDTKLVVVLGHSACGAVTATLDHLTDPGEEPAEVVALLDQIEPALLRVPEGLSRKEKIEQGVQKNVERGVRRLSRVPDLRRNVATHGIKIVGAVYDMHTGTVEILE